MKELEQFRYSVLAAQREGNRLLAGALRPLAVTPAQAEVLRVLQAAGAPLSLKHIGERLVCESGSPSRLVASLVQQGLVTAAEDPTDRRARAFALTTAGTAKAQSVEAKETAFYQALATRIEPAAATAATQVLAGLLVGTTAGRALELRGLAS